MRNTSLTRPRQDLEVLQSGANDLFAGLWPPGLWSQEGFDPNIWRPRTDVWETDNEYVVRVDVPGVEKDAFQVTLEDGTLRITGERRMEESESKRQFNRIERLYGRFNRSFTFGRPVDADHIEAELENGVLTVRVPKSAEGRPRRIDIK